MPSLWCFVSFQKQMIDLTRTTGQKLLFEGKHEEAVPAAMQSLRFAIDVHGLASIELVPSYLILGEASIGQFVSLNFFSLQSIKIYIYLCTLLCVYILLLLSCFGLNISFY